MEEDTQIVPVEAEQKLAQAVQRYRELLVAANPDAVPELIQGEDVATLDASLAGAKAAFARAREAARATLLPAGAAVNPERRSAPPPGLDAAGPLAKIAWGLRERG